jgi:hypothetical protein
MIAEECRDDARLTGEFESTLARLGDLIEKVRGGEMSKSIDWTEKPDWADRILVEILRAHIFNSDKPTRDRARNKAAALIRFQKQKIEPEETGECLMATWVNRDVFWVVDNRIVPARVISQNLDNRTLCLLLENGARHTAPAYDVHITHDAARIKLDLQRFAGSEF